MPDPIEERMSETKPAADAAAAASVEELLRRHEIDQMRMKASRYLEAAALIEEFRPKTAATFHGEAFKAMKIWSRMVSTDTEDTAEDD